MPAARLPDPPLPMICTAVQARAAGLTVDQIRHRVRAGLWVQLARGVYTRGQPGSDPRDRHLHRALAAALVHPTATIGFASAALLHGLPLHRPVPEEVTLCVRPGQWSGRRAGVHLRQALLPEDLHATLRCELTGTEISIVTAACAWAQVTSHGTLADGLVSGDAGLRAGTFTHAELTSLSHRLALRRGRRIIDLALMHLDARRESPLESQSWAYLLRHRIPLPQLQVDIVDEEGGFIGRVDVLWPEAKVIGEVDGRSKYATPDDVYREKRREDALRAMGFEVIRWGSSDLRSRALALRITRTLERRGRIAA